MLVGTLLAGVYKATKTGAQFMFFGADWLYAQERKQERPWMLPPVVVLRQFPLCILMHIKVH